LAIKGDTNILRSDRENKWERLKAAPAYSTDQPLRTIGGGGGALPLPTKHPAKLIELITKTIASATFCMHHPMNQTTTPTVLFGLTLGCPEIVQKNHTKAQSSRTEAEFEMKGCWTERAKGWTTNVLRSD
jgi:hypothetical protein